MPTGLLNVLTREQIFDLLTFLERGALNTGLGDSKRAGRVDE